MMKLLFKQHFFSWFDSYDPQGRQLGTVQEKILTFLPTFDLYEILD